MLQDFASSARRLLAVLLVLCFGYLSTACSPSETLTEEQVFALEDRVHTRWQALVARDFDEAWTFASPAYRATFSRDLYRLKFSYTVEWELTSIEVVNYDARAAVASVVVRVMSKPTKQTSAASVAVGAVPMVIRERWILIDGEWWYSANA